MAYEPILGKDVLFQVLVGEFYDNYACATSLSIDFTMETKPTKTVGDGVWKRSRGQSLSYQINLEGVTILYQDSPNAFTMIDYFKNMVDVTYRIIYTNNDDETRYIEGIALPTNVNLTSGSEGHATDSITLEGNGEPSISGFSDCDSEIVSVQYKGEIFLKNFTITEISGSPVTRYDYTLDGGGTESLFTDGTIPYDFKVDVPGSMGLSHQLIITPICESGYPSFSYTINFVKQLGP
jgi:hypothetical protein